MEEILFVTDSPNCTKIFRENIGPCPGIDGGYISAICTKRAIEYDSNMKKLKPLLEKYKSLLDVAEKTHVEQTSGNSQPEA